MDDAVYKKILKEQPVGFAYLTILRDESGNPTDYELSDMNSYAQMILKAFKEDIIIGDRLTELMPINHNDRNNLRKLLDDIAVHGGRKETEQYSLDLNHYYYVMAFRFDPDTIIVYFLDMSNMIFQSQLPTRDQFNLVLQQEWERANRNGSVISVIMLDVDDFRNYNDAYGFIQSDQCLYIIAQTIRKVLKRPADFAVRLGSDEFACILPETDLRGAALIGENIRKAIQEINIPHKLSPFLHSVSVSIGAASIVPNQYNSFDDLLCLAESALKSAKSRGKNTVVSKC